MVGVMSQSVVFDEDLGVMEYEAGRGMGQGLQNTLQFGRSNVLKSEQELLAQISGRTKRKKRRLEQ